MVERARWASRRGVAAPRGPRLGLPTEGPFCAGDLERLLQRLGFSPAAQAAVLGQTWDEVAAGLARPQRVSAVERRRPLLAPASLGACRSFRSRQAGWLAGRQAGRQPARQVGRQVRREGQARMQAGRQAVKQEGRQAGSCGRQAGRRGRQAGGQAARQRAGRRQAGSEANSRAEKQASSQPAKQAGKQAGGQTGCRQALDGRPSRGAEDLGTLPEMPYDPQVQAQYEAARAALAVPPEQSSPQAGPRRAHWFRGGSARASAGIGLGRVGNESGMPGRSQGIRRE